MDGSDLSIFIDELNGGASIGETLKFQLVNAFKANLEQERPWVVLRKTDTSKSVTTASTWQSAIDLSTLTRFNRFHGSRPRALAIHKGRGAFDDAHPRALPQHNADG